MNKNTLGQKMQGSSKDGAVTKLEFKNDLEIDNGVQAKDMAPIITEGQLIQSVSVGKKGMTKRTSHAEIEGLRPAKSELRYG